MRARRRYHRILGGALALPWLWLCLTGLILNHSAELRLDQKTLRSSWLTSFYLELPAPGEGFSYQAGSRTVSQWGDHLFLDQQMLPYSGELVGSIPLGPSLLIATSEHLYLLDAQSQLLDSVGEAALPAFPLQGLSTEPIPTLFAEGEAYQVTADLLDFPVSNDPPSNFPQSIPLADSLSSELQATLIAQAEVSYYRVWLDLHKFSFLGSFGKWVLTFSTVGLIILAITGVMLFRKRKVPHPVSS